MSEYNHDLVSEFPELRDRIHTLKVTNSHFQRLFEEYHDVTRAIGRSEQRIDLLSELDSERLRKLRLSLKDELYEMMISPR